MGKDTSTSSSNRFSLNGSLNTTNAGSINNNNNNNTNNISNSNGLSVLPLHHPHQRDRSPDLEAYGNIRSKKSRTPSPPLSPDRGHSFFPFLKRRWTKKSWLLLVALMIGLLVPIWIFTSGVITLDSFNDAIRYLPGYHYFANNLLYLVMFLLLVSFTVLATLPILPIFILGLPFHLLIFSIFNKLMSDWVWWCIGCYTVLFLAPVGSLIVARIRATALNHHDARRELFIRHKPSSLLSPPSPSYIKYSPLHNDLDHHNISSNNNNNISNINSLDAGSVLDQTWKYFRATLMALSQRVEYLVHVFSTSNRTSTRWRLLLALALWLSYVLPVTIGNESRIFDVARSAPSFDIKHPELLCSAKDLDGFRPRHESFEGYWEEYLQFHHQMVLPEEHGGGPDDKKRFLVFQPSDDGLGNRLQALLSSVVMAMVTRRAIILDWVAMPQCNANFTDLFQQPEGLVWDLNTTLPTHKSLAYYKSKPEIWYPYCRNCALRSPITPESTWSTLLCEADLGLNESIPLVQVFSTQWFLPVIQHNPHWRRELCHMFPHHGNSGQNNAFEVLAKKLLKPSTAVQNKIDSVMERIPEGVTLIGLQVRRTENNAVGQGIEDSFLSCAAEVVEEEESKAAGMWMAGLDDLLARRDSNSNSNKNRRDLHAEIVRVGGRTRQEELDLENEIESSMVQQGHALVRKGSRSSTSSDSLMLASSSSGKPKFAYYLATDYRPTRAHFQRILGDQLYVLDNTFQSHKSASPSALSFSTGKDAHKSPAPAALNLHERSDLGPSGSSTSGPTSQSQTEAVVRNSVQGVQTAVAEMFLLAQADRIISSPYSTFGYFAHGYSNVQPNIVKRDGSCIKRRSTQPCFQYWFGFANGGAKCNIKATVEMSEDYDCWL